jgi:hypothetical protein
MKVILFLLSLLWSYFRVFDSSLAKIKLLEKSLLLPSMRSQVMNIEGCLQNKRIDLEIQSAARDEINQNLKELGNVSISYFIFYMIFHDS